jgi:hypothetical protein
LAQVEEVVEKGVDYLAAWLEAQHKKDGCPVTPQLREFNIDELLFGMEHELQLPSCAILCTDLPFGRGQVGAQGDAPWASLFLGADHDASPPFAIRSSSDAGMNRRPPILIERIVPSRNCRYSQSREVPSDSQVSATLNAARGFFGIVVFATVIASWSFQS